MKDHKAMGCPLKNKVYSVIIFLLSKLAYASMCTTFIGISGVLEVKSNRGKWKSHWHW